MHPYDIIFAGLALDIVGAVVLAKGFMFKDPQAAYFEALTVVRANNHFLKSAILQRAEAQVGAGLLVIGFLLQIWGNLHGGIAAAEPGWVNSVARVLLVVIGAVAVATVCLRLALWRARAKFYGIIFRNYSGETKMSPPRPNDPTWYDRTAMILDLKRRRGESDAQLLARLRTRQFELGQRYGGQAKDFLVDE